MGEGFCETVFAEVGECEVVVGAAEGRVGLERGFVGHNGFSGIAGFEMEVAEVEGEGGGVRGEFAGGELFEGGVALAIGHERLDLDEQAALLGGDAGFDARLDAVGAVEGFQEGGVFPVGGGEGEGLGGEGREDKSYENYMTQG